MQSRFCVNSKIFLQTPGAPNFAEFHARGDGGLLPVMPRDLIPFGAHTSPRRSGKADLGSRDCQPQGCASTWRRAAATGGWRRC